MSVRARIPAAVVNGAGYGGIELYRRWDEVTA